MDIYVSTSSSDLEQASERMSLIHRLGHRVVYDWTESFNEDVPRSSWPRLAQVDVRMVQRADAMVLFGEPTPGCYVELGAAMADEIPVVWVTNKNAYCNRHFFLHYEGLVAIPPSQLRPMLDFVACCKGLNR